MVESATYTTKTIINRWNGRNAVQKSILKGNSKLGLRIVILGWVDKDKIEIKVISGDGRLPEFEKKEELELIGDEIHSEEEVISYLIKKHF
jgi:hypothetical protein